MENENKELEDFEELEDEAEEEEIEEEVEDEGEENPEEETSEEPEDPKVVEKEREAKKEQNRINAQRRKEEKAKREAELEKQGYNKALKEAVNGINPYTNKPITDDADMDIYLEMRELEKQGKDPVADYADFVAEKSRKARLEAQTKKQQEDYATKDIDAFSKEYPDIDVSKLLNDEHFNAFADGKLGAKPLTEIYQNFLKFESFYEKKAEVQADEKAVKKFSRTQSAMGSMKNPGEPKKKSYLEMSDEEFEKELAKVKGQVY
jgi:hypothetical protein